MIIGVCVGGIASCLYEHAVVLTVDYSVFVYYFFLFTASHGKTGGGAAEVRRAGRTRFHSCCRM